MNVIVAVTGGISAYKACDLIIGLKKNDCDVRVIMTGNAKRFISPLTLATLSAHPVMDDMWSEREGNVDHVEVSKWADKFVVYPATANIIAKFANGIADDLLSTVYLALPKGVREDLIEKVEKYIFPAMNTEMLSHPAVQRNIEVLREEGVIVTETRKTLLACGDEGYGGLLKPRKAVEIILGDYQ